MKAFFKRLGEMFTDKNGKVSYKRVTGSVCFVVSIFIAFFLKDELLTGLFLAPGVAAAGLSLAEKKE